jgi:tRNA pseudouridine65 synthase
VTGPQKDPKDPINPPELLTTDRLARFSAEVIYHDENLLVVNKPSGMLVHRGWGRDGEVLVDFVRRFTGNSSVHPVHRLDRGTSGVILFALNRDIARHLGALFDARLIEKRYLALVRGRPQDDGVIDHPLPRRLGGERVESRSTYRRLATAETEPRHVSLVEVKPLTGRLHQVRRHLKHINHPVIGDANYGKGKLNRAFRASYGLHRLALHAISLSLPWPEGGQITTFHAPLPASLREPFERMGFESLEAGA